MKLLVRVMDKVFRTCDPSGIGPVYTGSPRHYNNDRIISHLYANTYAGKIILAHPRIYINNLNMAMHKGICECGYTLTGAPRVFMA